MAEIQLNKRQLALLEESIYELDLTVRTANILEKADILSIQELLDCCAHKKVDCDQHCHCRAEFRASDPKRKTWTPRCYLLDLANFGEQTLQEVRTCLAAIGFGKGADD